MGQCWSLRAPCRSLCRRLEELAADQHAADLLGAGADLVELRIAQQPASGEVVDVAVAAERLDRLERGLRGALGREQDAAGGIAPARGASVATASHRVNVG